MNMPNVINIRDDRHMRSLTGLTISQFDIMCSVFSEVYKEQKEQEYEEQMLAGIRQRAMGGGRKGKLRTIADKLLFELYYFKQYPTFDALGTQFDLCRSKAHENFYYLLPILHKTLVNLEVMPHRTFDTVQEMKAAFEGVDQLLIDATERAHRRPQDEKEQKERYSGKKKSHDKKHNYFLC